MLFVAFRGMLITTSRQASGDFTAIALCRLMAARHAHIVLGQTGGVQRLWCCSFVLGLRCRARFKEQYSWSVLLVVILSCAQSASEREDGKVIQGYTWIGVKKNGDRMGEGYRARSLLIFNVSNTISVFLPGNQPRQKVLEYHSPPKMLSCKSPSTKLKMVCLKSSPQPVQNNSCETSKYLNCLAWRIPLQTRPRDEVVYTLPKEITTCVIQL